jgi:putative nucleotidyltransferase with HDIG domain
VNIKSKALNFTKALKTFRFLHVLIYIGMAAVMFLSMYSNIKPEKVNLELFEVSEKTIRSPITIEDKESTAKKRKEAAEQVEDVYTLKKEYAENRVDLITSIFDSIKEVNQEFSKKEKNNENEMPSQPSIQEKVQKLREKLPEEINSNLSDLTLSALFSAPPEQFEIAKDAAITAVNNVMNNRISMNEIEDAKNQAEKEVQYATVDIPLKNAVLELVRFAIIPNLVYDPVATEEKRQQAIDEVEPVKILQGQIIVEEGQLITREIYRQLELVGILDNDSALQPFSGLGILIIIMISVIFYHFHENKKRMAHGNFKHSYIVLYGIIFSITIVVMKIISLFQEIDYTEIGYIVPVAMGPMLIKILINERLAILSSMIFSVCGSIIFNEGVSGSFNFTVGVYLLFGSLAGILFLGRNNVRSKILQAGLFVSFVNMVVITSILLLKNGHYSSLEFGSYLIMASVSGLVASVLTIGFLPFFESGFGILSAIKLIELSNPNHPLLRKILVETPGTYHHSVMVANLSEAACEAIGANGLLARVGSYYHDIGKTKHPQYFIENQMNMENPHDHLPPNISKNIIIAHVSDGVKMLKEHNMPKEIVEIAQQHHGTTLLKYFYHKALEGSKEKIDEKHYRYPGPKAQTKEIAIIGIADSVEAAVRSLSNPTPEKIESIVKNIIADRLRDGQFDECDITIKELNIVAKTLCETLQGIFHSRIEYPESTNQKVKEA